MKIIIFIENNDRRSNIVVLSVIIDKLSNSCFCETLRALKLFSNYEMLMEKNAQLLRQLTSWSSSSKLSVFDQEKEVKPVEFSDGEKICVKKIITVEH